MNWHQVFIVGCDVGLLGTVGFNFFMGRRLHKAREVQANVFKQNADRQEQLEQWARHQSMIDVDLHQRYTALMELEARIAMRKPMPDSEGMNDIILSIMEIKETKH